ncbi:hypothetical protein Lal_00027274 [Lupinus albus]|uniref:Putative CRIB domain-containing protein n=1 Tax=Lupinus albus TaxID=3870 RepID=A0A6A4QUH4_LUPAL|nr:putative CRIB domain-containing protein [Lupinus albus]KAF1896207.1 hypothetical protein Lal_00027274 [Lupinus albus]
MRHRMERLVILPFSAGCISDATVAVGVPQPRRSRSSNSNTPAPETKGSEDPENLESLYGESMKNLLRFLDVVPKPNISNGFNRIFKGFKNFSRLFVEKEEDSEELGMEIGCPTDVQHVTHIGWDGIATTTSVHDQMKGWDNLIPPHLLFYNASNLDLKHETLSPLKPSCP